MQATRTAGPTGWAALVALTALCGCAQGSHGPELSLTTGSVPGYTLSAAEMHWNCAEIDNARQARITRIAALTQQANAESEATPPTLARMVSRLMGNADSPSLPQIAAERGAADAYYAELKTRRCAAVDLDAKLPPKPVIVTANK